MEGVSVTQESVLFITLDSCRFDSFERAHAPALKSVGPLRPAIAPSHFTYGSHSAMFVGFTPQATFDATPLLNPKFAKLFKLVGPAFPGKGPEAYELSGSNIITGFKNRGFLTLGAAAMGWFDPAQPTGGHLSRDFDRFNYIGPQGRCADGSAWLGEELRAAPGRDVFAFFNVGETHVPYWFEGAPWPRDDNPCVPFQAQDRRSDCEERQRLCVERVDTMLAPLISAFAGSTILLCADHGDAWGEDGVWEHGVAHPAALKVPLLMRVRGRPV